MHYMKSIIKLERIYNLGNHSLIFIVVALMTADSRGLLYCTYSVWTVIQSLSQSSQRRRPHRRKGSNKQQLSEGEG